MKVSAKVAAALLSGALAASSLPFAAVTTSAADGDILVTGFEDGDVSMFAKRGDTDTSVIGTTTENVYDGTTCMAVTGRSKGWNGPSLALSSVGCEPGVQYLASAWVKTQWYNTINLSMQYTDSDGTQHYSNLTNVVSQGDWVQIPETKFSFSSDMLDVQIYIEGSDAADLFVDNFSLTLAPSYPIQTDIASLKDVYADYFKIGGAVTASELAPQSTKDLILKHYNSITLGNELKPENMLDQSATIAYMNETGDNTTPIVRLNGSARIILDFCRDNNIPVRGHVLVWHSQTPGWFFKEDYTKEGAWVDVETMTKRMEAYIKGVFAALEAEYPDVDFYAWDVVNEAWLDDGKPRTGGMYDDNGNYSGWTQIWGDNSFIELAFRYARKYAPEGCKLYYNDFNEYMPQKTAAIIDMANDLAAKGLIDGIGCQSHPGLKRRRNITAILWMSSSNTLTASLLSSSGARPMTRAGAQASTRCSSMRTIPQSPHIMRSPTALNTRRPLLLPRQRPRQRPQQPLLHRIRSFGAMQTETVHANSQMRFSSQKQSLLSASFPFRVRSTAISMPTARPTALTSTSC